MTDTKEKLESTYGAIQQAADGGGAIVSLHPEAVALPKEKVISVTVYVLGINDCHEPDVFVTQVTCSETEYYEESQHLTIAEERARATGFSDPIFSFDEQEHGVIEKLAALFSKRHG
ncbi:MAG TPA: hypothetical protein DEP05_09820 [Betaproteobacteria bacterium]|nr:hypothetical protein [Betaproteobacteria bacterium]